MFLKVLKCNLWKRHMHTIDEKPGQLAVNAVREYICAYPSEPVWLLILIINLYAIFISECETATQKIKGNVRTNLFAHGPHHKAHGLTLLKESNYSTINFMLWKHFTKPKLQQLLLRRKTWHAMHSTCMGLFAKGAYGCFSCLHIDGKCPVCEKLNIQCQRFTYEIMLQQ